MSLRPTVGGLRSRLSQRLWNVSFPPEPFESPTDAMSAFGEQGKRGNDRLLRKAGVPGLETWTPFLFSEGVGKGRIDLQTFVAITATNPAKLFGLHPRKGSIAPGMDADIGI